MAVIMETAMPAEAKAAAAKRRQGKIAGARTSTSDSTAATIKIPSLEIRLFGPMEVRVNGLPLPHLRSRKGLWLLAILALRGGRDVDRDWIAGTLWPDCDEVHGRRSLRQSLHDLRVALGSEGWRLKSDEPRTLRLALDGASVDALEFDATVNKGGLDSLAMAAGLYRGPLLEDCNEDWALEGRRQREQAYLASLDKLASGAANKGQHGLAANHLRAALEADPFREDLLRRLIEALTADGSPAAALLAYRQYRALLGRELAGEPDSETTALFQRLKSESFSTPKSTQALPSKPSQEKREESLGKRTLPIPVTALIGREKEVREVISLAKSSRLITLTGSGGVGKTRLAIQAATDLAKDFQDGASFVDLTPLDTAQLLPDAIRIVLGAPAPEGIHDSLEFICSYLAERRMLLVLDNCEHLGGSCGSLAETLLSRCEGLKILATSRHVLGVKGEVVWRVPSLAVPKTGSAKPISAQDITRESSYSDYSAVRLFAERARSAQSAFKVTPKSTLSMVKICSLLDGIPLAIELAAARVKALPIEKIAERLNDRFRILLGDRRVGKNEPIPRQETLRASIDWSYDLLSEHEQIMLRRLSVFFGGWTLEAAESVCAGEPIREWEVLDLLTSLVEKSLVIYQPDEDRYRLLETIRQYLTLTLEKEGSYRDVATKHLDYHLAFAEIARPELIGPRQALWMDRLESDHDNLRAALSWSRSGAGIVDKGFQMVTAIWRFWQVRGFIAEGRAQIDQSLKASKMPSVNRAGALNVAGILAYRQSDYSAARAFYEESLALRRQLGDRRGIASTLNNLANMTKEQGDRETARAMYEESLAIHRELGDRWGAATCLQNLGTVHYFMGDIEKANELYEESLKIHREIGDPTSMAFCYSRLGSIADQRKDYAAARSLHEQSLAIRRELGDRMCIAMSLYDLGQSYYGLGDYQAARSLQKESLEIHREIGNGASIVQSLEAFADLALEEQKHSPDSADRTRAARLLAAAQSLREAVGFPVAPCEEENYRRQIERAKKSIGEHTVSSVWEEGRALSIEQAIEYALTLVVAY